MDEKDQTTNGTKPANSGSTVSKTSMMIAVVIALLLAFPAGYVLGNMGDDDTSTNTETSEHTHTDEMTHGDSSSHEHMHEAYEVPEGVDAPEITMIHVTKDNKSGWNLHFMTDNFTFTPENASSDHVEGEGHAHLYIDGEKITRLYSNNYYLGELSEGEHTIRVTLNTNDHKDYSVDNVVVEASETITDMHHSDDAMSDEMMHEHSN